MAASTIGGCVEKTRFFPHPPHELFRAWTSDEELARWWCPGRYFAESVRVDLKVGGSYEIVMADDRGSRQRLSGVYLEIRTPERLVMTWRLEGSPADDGYEAILTLDFRETAGGTLLQLTHERLRAAGLGGFDVGWEDLLPKLVAHMKRT